MEFIHCSYCGRLIPDGTIASEFHNCINITRNTVQINFSIKDSEMPVKKLPDSDVKEMGI
jgi:hypothetical protein